MIITLEINSRLTALISKLRKYHFVLASERKAAGYLSLLRLPYTLNQTINNNFSLVNRILAAAQDYYSS